MHPVVHQLISRFHHPNPTKRRKALSARRLSVESLESRRVLAATIASFAPTASGFTAELSEQVSTQNISLYDTESQVAGAADVTLQGAVSGNVRGSLVVSGTSVTFIATGGPLAADTYTATLRSATNAFTDLADGELLDGDGDGFAGGDYVTTFTVTNASSLVVGLPDIVRGPTQSLQGPATGSGTALSDGLPIMLTGAAGVTSVTLTLQYDPALIDISGVQLATDAPAGSQVESNLTVPGVATISFFTLEPLAAGSANIVSLIGSIPENAIYGSMQTLHISSLDVNAGGMTATADDALLVIAFPGDVNGNRRYDAEDARLIARVGVGLDTGFVTTTPTSAESSEFLFPAIDPVLLADVTGVDGISPLDASDVLRRVVGISTPNIPALPDAQAPTGLSLSNLTVGENQAIGTTVATFTTADPDISDTHTYSLVAGDGDTDNALFSIVGNSLTTASVFDTTIATSYSVRVQTTDPTGRSLQRVFTIAVTDTNVAPTSIALSNSSIAENQSAGIAVGTLSTFDSDINDTFTYSVVSVDGSTTNTAFATSGSSLITNISLDFETQSAYTVVVRSTDQGGLSVDQTFTISVLDTNDAPTALSLSAITVVDNASVGTTVGTLSTVDADLSDAFFYTLVAGDGDTDNGTFVIVGDQLQTASVIDFASQSGYSVRVLTTDSFGATLEQSFTITEGDAAPTAISLSNATIAENGVDGNFVGTLTTSDDTVGDTFTYTLVAGDGDTDNTRFAISGDQLVTVSSLNAELNASLEVRVRSTDFSGQFTEQSFIVTVANVNESATIVSLSSMSVADGQPVGTIIGTFSSDDPDTGDSITYSLIAGSGDTDNASFTISGDQLLSNFVADQLSQASYSIHVFAQDAEGLGAEQTFSISVTEANTAPTALTLSGSTIAEDAAIGTSVGVFTSTDANVSDTFTYELVTGDGDTDNAAFAISGDTLTTATTLDVETQSSYTVRVRSTDQGGLSVEQEFAISVSDVNDAPTAIALSNSSVAEDAAIGTSVGVFTSTDANVSDTFTYELVAGDGDTDNAVFSISGDTLTTANTLDFETQSSYTVRVRSTDQGGLFVEQELAISVSNANDAPTAIALSDNTLAEDATFGTSIGLFTTVDSGASDTFTYELVAGDGDTDNAAFAISGDTLTTATTLDFETQSSYTVRVRSTDSFGLSVEQDFAVEVTNVNEAPTALDIDFPAVASGEPAGTLVGLLSSFDPDSGDTFTYSLVAGDGDLDNDKFAIVDGQLTITEAVDDAIQALYTIRVRTQDAGGLSFEDTTNLIVSDANVAPTEIQLSNSVITDGAAIGTTVGEFTVVDGNVFDTHTLNFVAGEGDTDNASFTIENGVLKTAVAVDTVSQSSYSIRLLVQDRYGLMFEQSLTLTVGLA